MFFFSRSAKQASLWALAASLALVGCSGGGSSSGGGGGSSSFTVLGVNVQNGAEWQINRPIQIEFSAPVDFTSVNLSSINLRQFGGANSAGEFFLETPTTVVFQPVCPTATDFSDAALIPGGFSYELTVVGDDQGAGFSVRGTNGDSLAQSERRTLTTPDSTEASDIFFDFVVGPPRPLIRGRDAVELDDQFATHIEVGGDASANSRLYFEETGAGVMLVDAVGVQTPMPLNLLSESTTQVSAVLFMNQPVSPQSIDGAAAWQFEASPNNWLDINSRTELVANCTSTGAILRSTPLGVLPADVPIRVVVATTLADLSGETNQADVDDFAMALTQASPVALSDEIFEDFVLSEENAPTETLHDFAAALLDPPAVWEGSQLSPGFDFGGDGGPGSNFDVLVGAGQVLNFNTNSAVVTGGPNFTQSNTTIFLDGVMNVRNLRVEQGGLIRFQGTNAATILATGSVEIFGDIDATGTGFTGVVTLNTTKVPEEGASGQCGGGSGGDGSPLTNASSPRGSRGEGAFGTPDGGGQGGEAGWNTGNVDNRRRGAGGGGGTFGADQLVAGGNPDESRIGLNAETGFAGNINANGAENPEAQVVPPDGGLPGPRPFIDGDSDNDFFGRRIDAITGEVVIGELTQPWAGSGGGGGGDASRVTGASGIYPDVPFKGGGDEKGGGGGGGGGSLSILAIGDIVFGRDGQVRARGGFGGGGESTNFVNRIGSASGGGSGGHVILQSAATIDMTAKIGGTSDRAAILATGGQGGAGADDEGGASLIGGSIETSVALDACPDETLGCLGFLEGAGGDGGPGIVQLHSPAGLVGPVGDILLPANGVTLGELCFPQPLDPLQPAFGRSSSVRSIWIRLGEGGFDINNPTMPKDPTFSFGGTDLLTGAILANGESVIALPSILTGDSLSLGSAPTLPFIAADTFTLALDANTLPAEFKFAPGRLRRYQLDFDAAGTEGVNFRRFNIVAAGYDSASDVITVTVDMAGAALTSFGAPGSVDIRLRPTFFEVETDGDIGKLPETSEVTVMFQAAPRNPLTQGPDESLGLVSEWVTDIDLLNTPLLETYQFIRFMVRFDIDKDNLGLDANQPRPNLNFLRVPFQY